MNRALSIGVLVLAILTGVFLFGNGLLMLIAPLKWYFFIPGVTTTGPYNQHFIRDIGLIKIFLGAAFAFGLLRREIRLGAWAAATVWLVAHALCHVWEVAVGICGVSALARDFPAVSLPALVGIALTVWAWRVEPPCDLIPRVSVDMREVGRKMASVRRVF